MKYMYESDIDDCHHMNVKVQHYLGERLQRTESLLITAFKPQAFS